MVVGVHCYDYLTGVHGPESMDQVQQGERHGEQAQHDVGHGQVGNQDVSCGQLYLASKILDDNVKTKTNIKVTKLRLRLDIIINANLK